MSLIKYLFLLKLSQLAYTVLKIQPQQAITRKVSKNGNYIQFSTCETSAFLVSVYFVSCKLVLQDFRSSSSVSILSLKLVHVYTHFNTSYDDQEITNERFRKDLNI